MRLNPSKLKSGDIILTNERNLRSKAICFFTSGKYSHAMFYLGGASYMEAINRGVHCGNLLRFSFKSPKNCIVLRLKEEYAEIEKACLYIRSKHGCLYSIPEAIRAGVYHFMEVLDFGNFRLNEQFCSRLISQAYFVSGVKLLPNKDISYVTPADLARSPFLKKVEDCYMKGNGRSSEFNLIKVQDRAVCKMMGQVRKIQKKYGVRVESVGDIVPSVMRVPKRSRKHADERVDKAVKKSGYLEIWKFEKRLNLANHNFDKLLQEYKSRKSLVKHLLFVGYTAREGLQRAQHNLNMLEKMDNTLLVTQTFINLEKKLIEIYQDCLEEFHLTKVAPILGDPFHEAAEIH